MDKPILISLTEPEANTLLQLLDVAVKAGGLQVADAALFFRNQVRAAHEKATATAKVVEALEKKADAVAGPPRTVKPALPVVKARNGG